jgi:hypothetical protein
VTGRFLRKKYKDPMTKDGEFELVSMAGQAQPGIPQQPQPPGGRGTFPSPQPGQPGGTLAIGGIRGVRSKSQENSIRSYRGATRYDQWLFTYDISSHPSGATGNPNNPGGRGINQPGGGPGSNPFPGRRGNTNPGSGGPQAPPGGGRGGFGTGTGPGAPPRVPTPPGGRGSGLQH